MTEDQIFTPAIVRALNANLAEYAGQVRGSDAKLLARSLGFEGGELIERTAAETARIRSTKKYANATTSQRAAMMAPYRKGGGQLDVRKLQRVFLPKTDPNARPLLNPRDYAGLSRLDLSGENYRRATLAVALSDAGIQREPQTQAKEYTVQIERWGLDDALDTIMAIEDGRGLPAEDKAFGMDTGWHKLRITQLDGGWIVEVVYSIIPSPQLQQMLQDAAEEGERDNSRSTGGYSSAREFRKTQRSAARFMAKHLGQKYGDKDLLSALWEFGFLANRPYQFEDRGWIADLGPLALTWGNVGQYASVSTLGRWHDRAEGITWSISRKSLAIISTASYSDLISSRKTLEVLGGDLVTKPGASTSKLSRQALAWVRQPGPGAAADDHRHLTRDGRWGHINCYPGKYEGMTHWDISACYFTVASRLQSPDVVALENQKPKFGNPRNVVASKWRELLAIIGEDKPLRNTLVGCMSAGQKPHRCWVGGKSVEMPSFATDWFPASQYVARAAWELCRQAAQETNAVLSVTDCVVSEGGPPAIWDWFGFKVKPVSAGRADICTPISFAVGPRETVPYAQGYRGNAAIHVGTKPTYEYYRHLA